MKRHLLTTIVAAALISCGNDSVGDSFSGIATVEKNDTTEALHFYDYAFYFPDEALPDSLENGDRVKFRCTANTQLDNLGRSYSAHLDEISGNLTQKIIFYDSLPNVDEKYKGKAILTPVDMHITRDYKRDDYFNITSFFTSKADGSNDDFVCLAYDKASQIADTTVLWLLHYQKSDEECYSYIYNTISVPLECLKKPDSEWINILVLRYGTAGDTISNLYTYGYKY